MAKMHLALRVNNKEVEALAEPRVLLIHLLREQLGITSPHIGCDTSCLSRIEKSQFLTDRNVTMSAGGRARRQ